MTSRRPALTAMGMATLQERSHGRAILGLGTGPARAGALDELRTQVLEIRSRLDAMTDPAATAGLVLDRQVPIWIAALGPRAVALAGGIADGVLLNWCTPERVAEARALLEEAADDAGRDPTSITVAAYIRAAIEDDPASDAGARRALAAAAGEYATYPAYRRQFDAMGVGAAPPPRRARARPRSLPRPWKRCSNASASRVTPRVLAPGWRSTAGRGAISPSSIRCRSVPTGRRRLHTRSTRSRRRRELHRARDRVDSGLEGRHRGKGVYAMTYTIAEPCIDVKDRACVDECPVDCIYEGPRMLYIQPDECVDCGACEPACPVTAIFYEDDVPGEWKQFTPINAEFFNDDVSGLGSPGGAAQVGPAAVDHPVVAGWQAL